MRANRLREFIDSEASRHCRCWWRRCWRWRSPIRRSPGAVQGLLDTRLGFSWKFVDLAKPLLLWINDGLMAFFFLLVGLEIKREVVEGSLSQPSQVALPIAGAIGGMAVPAVLYVAFNWSDPVALRGWAIPAATDIAFSLGVLAALGSRVPLALKVFLTTLAIVDDLGSILIIAIFYTDHLSTLALALAALFIAGLAILNATGVRRLAPYLVLGVLLWLSVLKSGVHATLAGVVLALFVPLKPAGEADEARPSVRLEHAIKPWSAWFIMPVFAFANAGLPLAGLSLASLGTAATRHRGRPVPGQADRHHAGGGTADRAGRCRHAGRWLVGPPVRRGDPGRHRLHHEPVHRHARLRRCGASCGGAAGRARGLAALGAGRLRGIAAGAAPTNAALGSFATQISRAAVQIAPRSCGPILSVMRRTSYEQMNCSIASALDVVGEPWTLLIVRDAFYGVRRFDDFQENLGIARNVLTARLKKLVEAGVFRKTAYRQRPLRHEYRLTDKGAALFTVIVGLKQWGDRFGAAARSGKPMDLVNRGDGRPLEPVLIDADSGQRLELTNVRAVAGPGADQGTRAFFERLALNRPPR